MIIVFVSLYIKITCLFKIKILVYMVGCRCHLQESKIPWYVNLKKFLQNLCPSKIYLSLFIQMMKNVNFDVEEETIEDSNPPPQVEELSLEINKLRLSQEDSSDDQEVALHGVFLACHPKIIIRGDQIHL